MLYGLTCILAAAACVLAAVISAVAKWKPRIYHSYLSSTMLFLMVFLMYCVDIIQAAPTGEPDDRKQPLFNGRKEAFALFMIMFEGYIAKKAPELTYILQWDEDSDNDEDESPTYSEAEFKRWKKGVQQKCDEQSCCTEEARKEQELERKIKRGSAE